MELLNRASPLPLYYQLKEHLLERIARGELAAGTMLPSERELQERFAISRATVRQALNELVNEGVLERRQGIGTIVAQPKITPELPRITSFSEDMQARGLRPGAVSLRVKQIVPPPRVRETFGIPADALVWSVYRLRLADGEPVGLQHLFVPPWLELGESDLLQLPSYYALLEQHGVIATAGHEVLTAGNASEQEAQLLRVDPGQALLLIERATYDQQERPVEYAQLAYRADRYRYQVPLYR